MAVKKPADEAAGAAADSAERRTMAEGNRRRDGTGGTRSRGTRETRSERIRNGTAVIYPRQEPYVLSGAYGSAREASGNRRPCRDMTRKEGGKNTLRTSLDPTPAPCYHETLMYVLGERLRKKRLDLA